MKQMIVWMVLSGTLAFSGVFEDGKKLFAEKCSLCHVNYIAPEKLKENFALKNNSIYMLRSPSVNMLADAMTRHFKSIRKAENYLKKVLHDPQNTSSICDPKIAKYFEKKRPMDRAVSNQDITALTHYFMSYQKHRNPPVSPGADLVNDTDSAASLVSRAQAENKRILIEAVSSKCHWCEQMRKEVIQTPEVQRLIHDGYVMAEVNVDTYPLPFGLQKKFKQITPTFFIVESDGTYVARYPGSLNKKAFLRILRESFPSNR